MSSLIKPGSFEAPCGLAGVLDAGLRGLASNQLARAKGLAGGFIWRQKVSGLGLPIKDLRKGQAEQAMAIYSGNFSFAGETISRGEQNIFCARSDNPHWQAFLHGFVWLADLAASGRELSRVQARALINEWLCQANPMHFSSWRGRQRSSDVMARRLIEWSLYARFLLENAPADFEQRFHQAVTWQMRVLYRRLERETNAASRLNIAISLCYVSVAFSGVEQLRAKAFAKLGRLLDAQIFPDGGHISRNPQVLRDLLADLVPLRQALETGRLEVAPGFHNVLERMLPALRFFTYADGGLSVFNGVCDTRAGLVRRILETDSVCGTPLTHAVHSGYLRLQQGRASVMVDVGKPALPQVNKQSGAGLMAFEFCDGSHRLVTNCGSVQFGDEGWRHAARQTQAHSNVCLDDQPVAPMLDGKFWQGLFGGPVILAAPNIDVDYFDDRQGAVFTGRHDGYAKRHGVMHERRLFLNAAGTDLRGQDCFEPTGTNDHGEAGPAPVPFAIRFHLHPAVRVTLSQDGASAVLLLANKSGWRFNARGARLKLEESVYLPEDGRVRKTMQLVLVGQIGQVERVLWAFKKIEKRKTGKDDADKQKQAVMAPELF